MTAHWWEVWRRDWWLGAPSTRYNPGTGDTSGAAVVLSSTFGSPDQERIQPTFAGYAEQAYQGNAVVYGLIVNRISLFSEAELRYRRRDNKKLWGDGSLALLENPWPNGTTGELLARMEQDVSLAGNAYIRNVDQVMLERLRPDRVIIVSELRADLMGRPYRVVIGFGYDRDGTGSATEFYDVDEVVHWSPNPDPLANWRGMSWLTPVIREINADQGLTQYKTEYLDHAATPNMIVKYDRRMTPSALAAVQDQILVRHGGVGNAFKTLLFDEGADVEVVGNSLEQMNFSTVQSAGENRIAVASGVPGIVAGLKEGLSAATYSNYAQAMRRFADLWGRPQWRSACAALAKFVPVPADSRLWYDTSDIAALQAGESERAEVFYSKAKSASELIRIGYDPDTVGPAVQAGDLSLLTHTGAVPTALYQDSQQPGTAPSPNGNTPAPALNGGPK